MEGRVRFIDQTRLPDAEVYEETDDYRVVCEAIRRLQIRGAPAIGVAAAFGLLLAVSEQGVDDRATLIRRFDTAFDALSATRPTAVNLFAALARMRQAMGISDALSVDAIRAQLTAEALAIQQEDIEACRLIGQYGGRLIPPGSTLLTHCNTGALATAGSGTALSIIVTAARQGKAIRVYVDETRPLFQGARLTSWELKREGIEAVLITDSTAGLLMQRQHIHAVVVGADRIAANGDVANKVGTYPLAVLASRHGIPFYVAAPTSTIDLRTPTGLDIPIEERDPAEVTHAAGVRVAPPGVSAFAPAFDITPNDLISAIVTEVGVLRAPFGNSIAEARRQPALAIRENTQ